MKSFKTELKLNNHQKTMMAKHAGVARHTYDWGKIDLKTEENDRFNFLDIFFLY